MKSWVERLAFAIGLALAPRAWAGDTFEAVLVGSNEVPGPGLAEGSFAAVVVVEGTKVSLTLTPKEIRGWMAAHIHKGAAGVAGKLVAEFPWASGDSSPRMYAVSVSARVAADLVANPQNYYVHVHLPSYPEGAARGQLAARSSAEAPSGVTPAPNPAAAIGYDPRIVQRLGSAPLAQQPPLAMQVQRMGQPVGGIPAPGPGWPGATSPTPKKDQTIDFAEARTKVYRDSDFRLDASASSGLRVFFTGSGDCTVYGTTVHILSAGKCWVTAHQPGDPRFDAAPDVDRLIPIGKASQRIDGAAPATKTYLDPDFLLGMSATSGLTVVFFAWGDCTVSGSYIHIVGAGSCSLTAHQPGDSNFLAAQIIDQQFPIAKADQTIEFAEFPNPYYGLYDLPLNALASSNLPVIFSAWGSCSVGGSALHVLGSGQCSVTADQPGDRNFNAAPSVNRTFQIVVPDPPQ